MLHRMSGSTGRDAGRPIRVALVNDYEIVVKGLARMFDSYQDRIHLVELDAELPLAEHVDIALYDTFAQPQSDSPQVERLIEQDKAHKVVLYSWNLQPELIEAARAKGAAGYLSKGLTAAELVEALEEVHDASGPVVNLGGTVSEGVLDEVVGGDWPGRAEGLTHREAGQVVHPQRLPEDGRRDPEPGRPLGRRPRLHARPGAHQASRHPLIGPDQTFHLRR